MSTVKAVAMLRQSVNLTTLVLGRLTEFLFGGFRSWDTFSANWLLPAALHESVMSMEGENDCGKDFMFSFHKSRTKNGINQTPFI